MIDLDRPRSPWLSERETLDNGFSRGWGLHFQPSEEYWLDAHNHFERVTSVEQASAVMLEWYSKMDAYRLGQSIMIIEGSELFDLWSEFALEDPRFAWMYWPDIDQPRVKLVERAAARGAVGLKLHNHRIMRGLTSPDIYRTPAWRDVFDAASSLRLPLLWHVAQRTGYSPYHGGGINAYWSEGRPRGVTITNEDLLQSALSVLDEYPGLTIIGAHQLHVGLARLASLFDRYDRLLIDTSCGFTLRWSDDFIDEDRMLLKAFVEKYQTRVMFGTDSSLYPGCADEYAVLAARNHMRFILRLGLANDALQAVAWRNAKSLFRLGDVPTSRRGNVRP
jgi:predicted TIM-barrel fold metal-dependent hydrolase